jgi:hypothetical protein
MVTQHPPPTNGKTETPAVYNGKTKKRERQPTRERQPNQDKANGNSIMGKAEMKCKVTDSSLSHQLT